MQDMARRLLAFEAAHAPAGGPPGDAVRAWDRLRAPLVRLAGVAGYRSLVARALALAAAEAACLGPVRTREDGSLEGFDASAMDGGAEAAIVAQLLGLLVTFIGEPLTRQLVREAWPDAPLDRSNPGAGGRP